jgi:methylenetetrahydrofolate reductase (NADPH)
MARWAADDDRVAAVALTDRVPSTTTHDPVALAPRVAELSGKTPLVHLSGKNRSAANVQEHLERLAAAGLENVLLVTGDVPRVDWPDPLEAAPEGFLDSVQAVEMARRANPGFFLAAAVTSFKYAEPPLLMQYLKLAKKVAHGARVAYNQVGFDLRKTEELPKYLAHRGLEVPAVASLYWPTAPFARFARDGNVAGVLATDDFVRRMEELGRLPDKGKALRQEFVALQILLARSFGYAGVHVGGFSRPDSVRAILDLADEIDARGEGPAAWWARWREILRLEDGSECRTAPPDAYYAFADGPDGLNADALNPDGLEARPSVKFRMMRVFHDVFFGKRMEPGGIVNRVTAALGRTGATARALYLFERLSKYPLVGCEGCGSCSLPETEYLCVQHDCGKKLPNGPCGGSSPDGMCEGRPERECAWIEIYRRAKAVRELELLAETFVPAKDPALEGTSSWINMATGRDHRGRRET